jgi:hypothetical protein
VLQKKKFDGVCGGEFKKLFLECQFKICVSEKKERLLSSKLVERFKFKFNDCGTIRRSSNSVSELRRQLTHLDSKQLVCLDLMRTLLVTPLRSFSNSRICSQKLESFSLFLFLFSIYTKIHSLESSKS